MSVTLNAHNILSVGSSTILYGAFGGFIAYMIINLSTLGQVRTTLCCIIGFIIFFSVLFSMGNGVDIAGHMGGMTGGLFYGLAFYPGIREKKKYFTLGGAGALAAYFLVMFLVFYLTD